MKCMIVDDEPLARSVITKYIKKTSFLELGGVYTNAIEAADVLTQPNDIDLLFLDVEMPELTGIEFLSTLKNPPQVIIMSAKEKYAINAFEYDVVDYLLKPYTYARFIKAVNKAKDFYQSSDIELESNTEYFFIKTSNGYIRIKYLDIIWVEALENYVKIFAVNDSYLVHSTLKSIEQKLSNELFFRIHRSYLINLNFISVIENHIIMIDYQGEKVSLPIAPSSRNDLYERINLIN